MYLRYANRRMKIGCRAYFQGRGQEDRGQVKHGGPFQEGIDPLT